MIKWFKNLTREGLQRLLFFGVMVLVVGAFILAFSLGDNNEEHKPTPDDPIDNPSDDNNKPNEDDPKPTAEIFKIPCDLAEYEVLRKFYQYEDEAENQEMSVIQFGSKYFLSRGISIKDKNDNAFDVLSTMSGTVKEVSESSVYGITVVVSHGDDIESEYISLSTANVKVGDEVVQGQKLGVSGKNEYDAQASNHLHFKVSKSGKYYNPLDILGHKKEEIE